MKCRVVYDQIETAEFFNRHFDQILAVSQLLNIARKKKHSSASLFDPPRSFLGVFWFRFEIAQDNVRTFPRIRDRNSPSNAAISTCNDGHTSNQTLTANI